MGMAFGFDPSFRHGSLILCTFEDHRMTDLKVIFSWGRKEVGIDYKAPITEAYRFCNQILETLPPTNLETVPPIAIDWDPQAVYWRAVKLQMVQMGSIIGYLSRGFLERGYPIAYITPTEVRKHFSISIRNSEKSVVYDQFLSSVGGTSDILNKYPKKLALDIMDSIILAYLIDSSESLRREKLR